MNIHQTLGAYVPAQDRCLMCINSHAGDELRLWFTQAAHAGPDASPERVMASSDSAAVKLLGCWALASWLAKLPWLKLRQAGFFTHGLQRLAANSCHRVSQQPRRLFAGLPNRVPFGLVTCDPYQKGKTVGHHRQPLRFLPSESFSTCFKHKNHL